MPMRRIAWLAPSIAAVMAAFSTVAAAGPWESLLPFERIDADPDKSYTLTEQNGPWMILASSFAGEGAEREAHELVMELRTRYRLRAYVHKKHYDFTGTTKGLGFDKYGGPKRMRNWHRGEFDEYAVLVGNFDSVDAPAAQKTLAKIKHARPKCLELDGRSQTTRRFAGLREFVRRVSPDENKKKQGPMWQAFVTRNPLLPKEFFVPSGPDRFVMNINKGVPHSLLDCPGRYSVRVATFRGQVIIDQRKIAEIQQSGKMGSRLREAAEKAHKLTEALRAKGVEAYEFHDRHESIVTVGSFDSVGTPQPDGRIEINRAVYEIIQRYGAMRTDMPVPGYAGLRPKSLDGIPFDVQPVPVEVPRKSIGGDYARGATFR